MSTDDKTSTLVGDSLHDHQSPSRSAVTTSTTRPKLTGSALRASYAGTVLDRRKLAAEVSAHAPGLSEADALRLVEILMVEILAGLRRDGDVTVPGLGRFQTKRRAARRGTNPNTGERINIPPKSVVTF